MNQHLSFRNSPKTASAILAAGVLLFVLFAYVATRVASQGEVMGHVEVAETDLGGLDPETALGTMVQV
ncbi:MAG TPA: hypothetical protein VIW94_02765, partial [Acidimicrobiia bacterium]